MIPQACVGKGKVKVRSKIWEETGVLKKDDKNETALNCPLPFASTAQLATFIS